MPSSVSVKAADADVRPKEKFMRSIIASLSLTVLAPIAFAEVEWKMDFSRLACTVTNSHGFFNSYSVPPSKGDNIQINLQAIVKKRSVLKFTPSFEVIRP